MRITRVIVAAVMAVGIDHGTGWCESAKAVRPWQIALTANADRWSSETGGHEGAQDQVYAQVAYDGDPWGISVTGRYLSTSYRTSLADESFNLSAPTDTAVASRYDWRLGRWTVRAGVDLDLPSGRSAFAAADREKMIADPVAGDLMNVTFYGGGFNVAPHLVVTCRFGDRLAVGVGGRYLLAGAYDPTTDVSNDDYDPGDRSLALLTVVYAPSAEDLVTASLMRIDAAEDRLGGEAAFKAGAITQFDLRWDRSWPDGWQGGVALGARRQDASVVATSDGALTRERLDANNNFLTLTANAMVPLADRWSLALMAGYKRVGSNRVEETNPYYDAGRTLGFAEAGVVYSASARWYTTAKVRYTRIDDKKDAFAPTDMAYRVANLDLALVYRY